MKHEPTHSHASRHSWPVRVLLHSHDSFGLGHLRRTMTIAKALRARLPSSSILITTGSPCATHFASAPGIDIVKLPSVSKDGSGAYVARSLALDFGSVVEIRRKLLEQIHESFAPDLLIVDHQVLGLAEELDFVLREARRRGTKTILGIRDIIDSAEVVASEWGRPRARQALAQEYDRLCVYGDPSVFDPRREYPMPAELRERLEFVGYVARDDVHPRVRRERGARPTVLVTVGGGEDGAGRIETFIDCLEISKPSFDSTIILGPLYDQERARLIKKRLRDVPGVDVHLFHADLPHLLSKCDAVVSMAGYNSVVEILQSGVPAVLCPRSFPRREQLLRAERMHALGLAECVASPSPRGMRAAIERALVSDCDATKLPPLDGATRLVDVALNLVSATHAPALEASR